jgi:outer membrane immunogenic protein
MKEDEMTKLMAATIALAAFTIPVLAADLPVRQYAPSVVAPLGYNWNGFYVGAHLGGAWASRDFNQTIAGAALVVSGTNKPSGVVGGGQIGANWQFAPNWLVGIEADVSGADLKDTVSTTSPGGAVVNWHDKIDLFGTVRGRLGYVIDNWLLYGTGGFAWVDDKFTRTQAVAGPLSPAAGLVVSNSNTATGWVAGAGVEWGFARSWTARVEYLHIDVQGQTLGFATPIGPGGGAGIGAFAVNENHLTIDTVRAGVNYLFN